MPIRVIFRSVFTVPPPSRCIRTILCRDSLPPGILVHSAFELECERGIHFAELPRVPASHHRMPRGGAARPCKKCETVMRRVRRSTQRWRGWQGQELSEKQSDQPAARNGTFAAGDWRAESASETISPRRDRKSETTTREKW